MASLMDRMPDSEDPLQRLAFIADRHMVWNVSSAERTDIGCP